MSSDAEAGAQAIQNARQAYQRGDHKEARRWAERAVALAPELEEGWLWLAAVSGPSASLNYLKRAQQINPESVRARQGLQWAEERLKKTQPVRLSPARRPRQIVDRAIPSEALVRQRVISGGWLVVLAAIIVTLLWGGWTWYSGSAVTLGKNAGRVLAQMGALPGGAPVVVAQAGLDKATRTPTPTNTPTSTNTPTPTSTPTVTPTSTDTPTSTPTDTPTPKPTRKPTKTPKPAEPQADEPSNDLAEFPDVGRNENWVDVNLSQQRAYAYTGHELIRSFWVSTGTWQHPTVTGQYNIYVRYRYALMTGPGYYLPNVPYVMYFYKGYGLHGTYWHHNFGTPMSHGCVNFSIPDAAWLYDFTDLGTLVNVHY